MPFPIAITCLDAPDVSDWPETCQITTIDFRRDDVQIWHTRQDNWPEVHIPGWGDGGADSGNIQWTLWPVIMVNGEWLTTGCLEFWKGKTNVGGPFSNAAKDWYYWQGRMAGHQPQPGDRVGFFVTTGDRRRKDIGDLHERSSVVWLTVPGNDTGTFRFDTPAPTPVPVPPAPEPVVPVPPLPPAPAPPTPIPTPTLVQMLSVILKSFQTINTKLDACATHADISKLREEITTQVQLLITALPASGSPSAIDAITKLFGGK